MSSTRSWAVIAFLSIGLAGVCAGYVVGSRSSDESVNADIDPIVEISSAWLLRSQDVLTELGLDPNQRLSVEELLADHYRRSAEVQSQLSQLSAETTSALRGLLSEAQVGALAEIRKRYNRHHLQAEVFRELVEMQERIELSPEQEPLVRQITFDYLTSKHDLFRNEWPRRGSSKDGSSKDDAEREKRRAIVREKLSKLEAERFRRLEAHLSTEQIATYREMVEKRRKEREEHRKSWDKRRRQRSEKSKDGKSSSKSDKTSKDEKDAACRVEEKAEQAT